MAQYSINLRSHILAGPTDISIIMPNVPQGVKPKDFYSSGKKFKVLWLLHAGDGDRNDWLNYMNLPLLLGSGTARNLSVGDMVPEHEIMAVAPNGLNSDFANHPEFSDGYYFSDFFFDELMPFIYNWFPASEDPKDNFLTGCSMGGAATWMYGLLHPEKFAAIAPLCSAVKNYTYLEPYRDLTATEFKARATANRKEFPAQFGNVEAGIHPKEVNMIVKFPTVGDFLDSPEHTWDRFREAAKAGKVPKTYLPVGTGGVAEDMSHKRVLEFKELSDSLGVKNVEFDFIPGYGHTYEFYRFIMPKVLKAFGI